MDRHGSPTWLQKGIIPIQPAAQVQRPNVPPTPEQYSLKGAVFSAGPYSTGPCSNEPGREQHRSAPVQDGSKQILEPKTAQALGQEDAVLQLPPALRCDCRGGARASLHSEKGRPVTLLEDSAQQGIPKQYHRQAGTAAAALVLAQLGKWHALQRAACMHASTQQRC